MKSIVIKFVTDTKQFTAGANRVVKTIRNVKKNVISTDKSINKLTKDLNKSSASMGKFAAQSKKAGKSVGGLGRKVSGVGKSSETIGGSSGIGGMLGKITPMAIAAGAGIATVGVALKKIFDIGNEIESLAVSFKTMLGSAEAATAHMKDLRGFAVKTPFEVADLARGSKLLLNFGVNVRDIMPTLKMLGDVAGSSREKFQSLALVFGQIQSTGKLMGQDLLQLINQGFNPLQVIAQKNIAAKMGISFADLGKKMRAGAVDSKILSSEVSNLKDEMSKGKISADAVTEAFALATGKGGLFFGNLEAQSKTMTGLLSTLVGATKDLAIAFTGADILDPNTITLWSELKSIVDGMIGGVQTFLKIFSSDLQAIGAVLGIVLSHVFTVLGIIIKGAIILLTPFIKIIGFVAKLIVFIYTQARTLGRFVLKLFTDIFGLANSVMKSTNSFTNTIVSMVGWVGNFINKIKILLSFIQAFAIIIATNISKTFDKIGDSIRKFLGLAPKEVTIKQKVETTEPTLGGTFKNLDKALKENKKFTPDSKLNEKIKDISPKRSKKAEQAREQFKKDAIEDQKLASGSALTSREDQSKDNKKSEVFKSQQGGVTNNFTTNEGSKTNAPVSHITYDISIATKTEADDQLASKNLSGGRTLLTVTQ